MEPALVSLPSTLALTPACKEALSRFCATLKQQGDLRVFAGLLEWWATLSQDMDPRKSISGLYSKLGQRVEGEAAFAFASQALDLWPSNIEALAVVERQARGVDQVLMRERYEAFLAQAPFHVCAPRIRQRLIDVLLEDGDYELALEHVKQLPPRSTPALRIEEIARACTIPPLPPQEATVQAPAADDPLAQDLFEVTVVLDDADVEDLLSQLDASHSDDAPSIEVELDVDEVNVGESSVRLKASTRLSHREAEEQAA